MSPAAELPMSGSPDAVYGFNRPVCFAWTVFCLVVAATCTGIALAADVAFVRGLVPGWLFGSFGAALFSVMALSWARRFTHSGPALVLSDWGIRTDKRLGGITNPSIDEGIAWDEISGATPGAYGSVVLRLRDPGAFWARQSRLARILAWHPLPRRRYWLGLGGNDLAVAQAELVTSIQSRLNSARLESPREQLLTSKVAAQDDE